MVPVEFNSDLKQLRLIDLTHTVQPRIPTWDGSCGFSSKLIWDYPDGVRAQSFECSASAGTHMDAPAHMIQGSACIPQIPLENLMSQAVSIDIQDQVRNCSSYQLTRDDILDFESRHGMISPDSLVVVHSGWYKRWDSSELYRNLNSAGQMEFPSISVQAAELLLTRKIAGLGVDTLSPDCSDATFPVHHLLLRENKYIIENLNHLDLLPPKGAWILSLPMKIEGATEAPCRVVALIPPASPK